MGPLDPKTILNNFDLEIKHEKDNREGHREIRERN